MAGFFDSLVKGISSFAPQDDPDIKLLSLNSELKELEAKEEKLYAAIGKRVYAEGGKAKFPEIAVQLEALVASRKDLDQSIKEAQAQKAEKEKAAAALEAEESKRRCPNCDATNPEGTKFCRECGTKLGVASVCPSCGETVSPGVRFCGGCGARLDA